MDFSSPVGLQGAGGVKNFSVGICDGAPSPARSSIYSDPNKVKRSVRADIYSPTQIWLGTAFNAGQ